MCPLRSKMCQKKSDTDSIINSCGFLDRNQKVIVTYSRSKLARTKSATSLRIASQINHTNSTMDYKLNENCSAPMGCNTDKECDKRISDDSTNPMQRHEMRNISTDQQSTANDNEIPTENVQHRYQQTQTDSVFTQRHFQRKSKCIQKLKSRTFHRIGSRKFGDNLLVLVILAFVTVHQTFAHPIMEEQWKTDLNEKLKFPCGSGTKRSQWTNQNAKEAIEKLCINAANVLLEANKTVRQFVDIEETTVKKYHEKWITKGHPLLYPKENLKLNKEFNQSVAIEIIKLYEAHARNNKRYEILKLLKDSDQRFQLLYIAAEYARRKAEPTRNDRRINNIIYNVLNNTSTQVKRILCEVRSTIETLGVEPVVLDAFEHTVGTTDEIFHNWVILRENVNQLDHLRDILYAIYRNIDASDIGTTLSG